MKKHNIHQKIFKIRQAKASSATKDKKFLNKYTIQSQKHKNIKKNQSQSLLTRYPHSAANLYQPNLKFEM